MDTKHSVDNVQCSQGESFYCTSHLSTFVDRFLHLHNISYSWILIIQGVPQLSIHFVSVILLASTHPNFKSWGSFDKFRKFAT